MSNRIPKSDYLKGLRLCKRNSTRLLKLADKSYMNKCYEAAYILGFSALEEIGKGMVILSHWDDDDISYDIYMKEFCNHKYKISLALQMIEDNILESLDVLPRGYLISKEFDKDNRDKLIYTRTESIYLDYDFDNKKWKNPLKDIERLSKESIIQAFMANSMFSIELKYRDIKLRRRIIN